MRSFTTFFSIAALASLAQAGGIIDNTAEAASIAAAASTLSGAGSYVFENVATGQTLSFVRGGSTTDLFPNGGSDSLAVQFAGTAARLSGGNNKCVSAQWSYEVEGGVDYAAVSYACAVGSGLLTGTATLEKTKQWWYLLPAGSSNDDDDNDDDDDSSDNSNNSNDDDSSDNSNNSNDDDSSSTSAALAAPSGTAGRSARILLATSFSANNGKKTLLTVGSKGYYETDSPSIALSEVDTSDVVVSDRKTWICKHPGWWLANHRAYVTKGGHVECASHLKAYLAAQKAARVVRRSRPNHSEMAKKLAKRATQYYIIPVDHILDMSTRAIGSRSMSTVGGYTSTVLSLWDKSDSSQLWTISSA